MKTGTISKAEDPDLREAQDRAIQYWESAHQFRRRTLEEAWKCGQALAVVKNELSRGEWMPWLDEVGITHDTASRWIRLAAHYESSQLADFGSVDQALKSLPPARRKRKRPDRGAPEPEKQESPTTDHKQVAETEGPAIPRRRGERGGGDGGQRFRVPGSGISGTPRWPGRAQAREAGWPDDCGESARPERSTPNVPGPGAGKGRQG